MALPALPILVSVDFPLRGQITIIRSERACQSITNAPNTKMIPDPPEAAIFYWLSTYSRVTLSLAGVMIAGLVVWLAVSSTGNLTINELEKTAQARLALYDSSLRAAIDRYRYLPYVVSRHHQVIDAIAGTEMPTPPACILKRSMTGPVQQPFMFLINAA